MDSIANCSSSDVRKFPSIYCPHCGIQVSKSTYYVRYKKYYDKQHKLWQLELKHGPSAPTRKEPDFDFNAVEQETEDNGATCESVEMAENFSENVEFMDSEENQYSNHEDIDYYETSSIPNVSLLLW